MLHLCWSSRHSDKLCCTQVIPPVPKASYFSGRRESKHVTKYWSFQWQMMVNECQKESWIACNLRFLGFGVVVSILMIPTRSSCPAPCLTVGAAKNSPQSHQKPSFFKELFLCKMWNDLPTYNKSVFSTIAGLHTVFLYTYKYIHHPNRSNFLLQYLKYQQPVCGGIFNLTWSFKTKQLSLWRIPHLSTVFLGFRVFVGGNVFYKSVINIPTISIPLNL